MISSFTVKNFKPGDRVAYGEKNEEGVVSSVSDTFVFVKYGCKFKDDDATANATNPHDLSKIIMRTLDTDHKPVPSYPGHGMFVRGTSPWSRAEIPGWMEEDTFGNQIAFYADGDWQLVYSRSVEK